ncbi:extracellular solute-binding protein [Occultella gossypii]|uniref:Extracellular solute-binding protein n=1 Tax=Occultella gossypii TaxID=2800820 RepID=A0ABS7SI65_9MICO|nr:extracellular solute-binding protein [Occultella gossypii]MBZ2199001.1 hypothetical protein [Occultella gossypii]
MSDFQIPTLSRRRFLAGSAGLAVSATVLSACGGGDDGGGAGSSGGDGGSVELPTFKKIEATVMPDLPGDGIVQDVYFSYPDPPYQAVEHPTGSGGELRAMLMTYSTPPTPMDQNSYWQRMNDDLGVTFIPDLVPADDYVEKFSTVIAGGGELPEIIQAPLWMPLPRMGELIKSQFTDLTEYLSGDAVLTYPNLANIPTASWKNAVNQGILWGVPIPRPQFPSVMYVRMDRSEQAGFAEFPKTQEEFLEWGEAMTDTSKQQYAFAAVQNGWMENAVNGMYEQPNKWHLDGDTLTREWDHPGYFDGTDFVKQVWDLGYLHPDTPGMQVSQQQTLFWNGTIAACENGISAVSSAAQYPDVPLGARAPWTKDGSKVHAMQNTGIFSVNALKKGLEKAKVEEYLNILDYLAAPFGSQEYTTISFGLEGEQYTIENGSPTPIQDKAADLAINLKYVATAPQTLYAPEMAVQDTYTRFHELQQELATGLVPDPCVTLRSETLERNGQYEQEILDVRTGYILGRKTLDDLKGAVQKYNDEIGAEVNAEMMAAIEARG